MGERDDAALREAVVAVAATIASDPTPDIPGTALKLHPAAELHVDREAAGA